MRPKTRNLLTAELLLLLGFMLACTSQAKEAKINEELEALAQGISEDPMGDCEQGLKLAKSKQEYSHHKIFGVNNKERKAYDTLVHRVTWRCQQQANRAIERGTYVDAVLALELWRKYLPESFPKQESSSSWMSTNQTALGQLNALKPKAAEQLATYEATIKAYEDHKIDPQAQPTLAYHLHSKLVSLEVPRLADAQRIAEQDAAMIERLRKLKAMTYALKFDADPSFAQAVEAKHVALVDKNEDFIVVGAQEQPYALIEVKLGKLERRTGKDVTNATHQYVSGTKTVKNDDYERAQRRIQEKQKEYDWQQKQYNSIKCSRGEVKGKDCARSYYQKMQSLQKDIAQQRKFISGGPTKQVKIYSNYSYSVDKPFVEFSYPVELKVTWPGDPKRAPYVVKDKLSNKGSAHLHPGQAKYGLPASNVPIPPDDKIIAALHQWTAQQLLNVAGNVRKDRASRPKPSGLAPAAEADLWLSSYCLASPLSAIKGQKEAFDALSDEAKALIGDGGRCDMERYYKPFKPSKNDERGGVFKTLRIDQNQRVTASRKAKKR